MDCNKLAELLFPNITETPEELETRYPPRDLPEGAKVTRFAPAPPDSSTSEGFSLP